MLRGAIGYAAVILAAAVLLEVFTPFPVLTWLGALTKKCSSAKSMRLNERSVPTGNN
jgi:hypothetical protein